jgi:hypothetical protein
MPRERGLQVSRNRFALGGFVAIALAAIYYAYSRGSSSSTKPSQINQLIHTLESRIGTLAVPDEQELALGAPDSSFYYYGQFAKSANLIEDRLLDTLLRATLTHPSVYVRMREFNEGLYALEDLVLDRPGFALVEERLLSAGLRKLLRPSLDYLLAAPDSTSRRRRSRRHFLLLSSKTTDPAYIMPSMLSIVSAELRFQASQGEWESAARITSALIRLCGDYLTDPAPSFQLMGLSVAVTVARSLSADPEGWLSGKEAARSGFLNICAIMPTAHQREVLRSWSDMPTSLPNIGSCLDYQLLGLLRDAQGPSFSLLNSEEFASYISASARLTVAMRKQTDWHFLVEHLRELDDFMRRQDEQFPVPIGEAIRAFDTELIRRAGLSFLALAKQMILDNCGISEKVKDPFGGVIRRESGPFGIRYYTREVESHLDGLPPQPYRVFARRRN